MNEERALNSSALHSPRLHASTGYNSMTLALEVPKMDNIMSGEFNNRRPFMAYQKEICYFSYFEEKSETFKDIRNF